MAARHLVVSSHSNNSNSPWDRLTDSKVMATELVSNLNLPGSLDSRAFSLKRLDIHLSSAHNLSSNSSSSNSSSNLSRQVTQASSSNHNLQVMRSNLSSRNRLDSNRDFSLKRLDIRLSSGDTRFQAPSLSSNSSSLHSLHNRRNFKLCSNNRRAPRLLQH